MGLDPVGCRAGSSKKELSLFGQIFLPVSRGKLRFPWREPPAPGNQVAAGSSSVSGWRFSAAWAMLSVLPLNFTQPAEFIWRCL